MKKSITVLFCFFFMVIVQVVQAGDVIFENREQLWELTRVQSNDDYTIISCVITILSNRAGCMDAHTYDKKNSSIYISGEFGRKDIIMAKFDGDYKPWEIYPGHYEWNYFRKSQKGSVVHATFYFPRIPAGVKTFDWHFDGGWADRRAPSRKYRSPSFIVRYLEVKENVNSTPQTGWSERTLKMYWQTHRPSPMEGIFNFISTSNQNFWGKARHRVAVKKDGDSYQIIYLHGSNEEVWAEGELKAVFSPTTTKGIYHVDMWYLDNKMLSNADFYIEYNERRMTLYDSKSYVETHFMKLYPAYDVEESDVSPLYPKIPPIESAEEKPKGNGSGFFISGSIVATNSHVVKDAKRIEIVINHENKVSTYKAKILCQDKINDIALLQIEDDIFTPLKTLPYEIIRTTMDVGTKIYTMSYPMANIMGQEPKITDGIINSKTGYDGDVVTYQISAPIQQGSSGGPVFNTEGNLVGITSSGILAAQNVGYAIKSGYLNNLIEAAPVQILNISHNTLKGKEFSQQIKDIKPYVTLILVY